MLTIGSLFAGVGGLELGLAMGLGGAETLWQVEYEEHARLILAQHWPEAERHQDVRHVGKHNLAPAELICGGWPCQPHSTAGKRLSSADERDLWGEFARVIGEIRPRWVVGENVPGVLSSSDPAFSRDHPGGFFGRVLRDLAEMGFDAEWGSFPASALGAHHRRERVFLVAYATGAGPGEPERWFEAGQPRSGDRGTVPRPLAHTHSQRELQPQGGQPDEWGWIGDGGSGTPHVAYTDEPGGDRGRASQEQERFPESPNGSPDVAHASRSGRQEQHPPALSERAGYGSRGSDAGDVAHAEQCESQHRHQPDVQRGRTCPTQQVGLGSSLPTWAGGGWEQPHPLTAGVVPGVRDLAHGLSLRVDRLTRLGNGVVPQQAAVIGRAIKEAEAHFRRYGVMPERLIQPRHFRVGGAA